MIRVLALEDMVASIQISPDEELKKIVRDSLKDGFERISFPVSAKWLLGDEPEFLKSIEDEFYDTKDLEKILFTREFENAEDRQEFLSTLVSVNEMEIEKIAEDTVGQMNNWLYCVLKKFHLTASNFGVTLSAIRRNTYAPSLYKRLIAAYNLNKVTYKDCNITKELV